MTDTTNQEPTIDVKAIVEQLRALGVSAKPFYSAKGITGVVISPAMAQKILEQLEK